MQRQNEDIFDGATCEQQEYFKKGLEDGQRDASQHDTVQVEKEGFQFGQVFGEEVAAYQEFIKQFLTDPEGKISNKIKKRLEALQQQLAGLSLENLDQVKLQRRSLAQKFKLILSMLGIKDYMKDQNETSQKLQLD